MRAYLIIILLSLFQVTLSAQSYKVIVNSSNTTGSLTKKELSDIMLKKKAKWADGSTIAPVDQEGNSAIRSDFSKEVHGRSVNAIQGYWQQAVFSGKNTPPVEKKSDADVIEFIKRKSGAIGYVSSNANVAGVKVIKIE